MAKVTVSFDRRVTRDGYYVGTTVASDSADTDPSSLVDSVLVATEGAGGVVRVATLIDLFNIPLASDDGLKLDYLTCNGMFNNLDVGDIITFYNIPVSWEVAGDAPVLPYNMIVTESVNAAAGGSVKVDVTGLTHGEFASGYSGDLEFEVTRGATVMVEKGTYPIIIGRYPAGFNVAHLYYRVRRDVTLFTSVETANNKYESLRAEFQSLVDESNTAGTDFEIPSTEVFE